MNKFQFVSKWKRFKELVLMTFLGNIPTIFLGVKLRNVLYRAIFARIGSSVFIQDNVEFSGTSSIEIGNGVYIFKGVYIDGSGHSNNKVCLENNNNKICLENGVALERNVNIGALDGTLIHINENTFIGPGTCIAGPGNIKIGRNCLIAAQSGIFANNHNFADLELPIRDQGITREGIIIEDDCWLGSGVKVLDGVTIGKGCVIGANSVVTKDIPPYSVAVGVPARVIKKRGEKELSKPMSIN
ncbi:hexapaptide repeat-containing transferase [Rivularia sp. IAM M-261]|nr:hexapaptide repeat-containing transferase [Calothrix sp. PCC 7716]GJD15357.1 hexapaptide repeat-containing transferase [Rivularia sp. IAM M-261]